jgi:hypothetical protein
LRAIMPAPRRSVESYSTFTAAGPAAAFSLAGRA